MNNDRISEIRARCEAATPGPWETALDVGKKYYIAPPSYGIRDFCYLSGGFDREQDASFIAHAREDILYLLSQLAAKDAEIERLSQLAMMREGEVGDRDREIGLMTEAQRWIPVTERLPKEKEKASEVYDPISLAVIDAEYHMVSDLVAVCVQGDSGEPFVCDDVLVDGKWSNFPSPEWEVTHWMPLPAAIEKGE